jgi:hypothetical protein
MLGCMPQIGRKLTLEDFSCILVEDDLQRLLSSSWDPYRDCISHTSIAASDRTVVTLTFPLHNLLANRHCWIRLLRNPLEISIPRRDDQSIFLDDTIP